MEKQNKNLDNPVPSIDKIKKLVEEEYNELKIDIEYKNEDDYQYGFNKACKMFKNSLLAKLKNLQNGVETDKEQPNYNTKLLKKFIEENITNKNELLCSEHEMLCQIMNILGYWETI